MDEKQMKQLEKFEEDYCKIASQSSWDPKDVTMMKDLQKLMYYIEVRDAMKHGSSGGWDDEEDMRSGRSYARNRNAMGQFTSGMGYGTHQYYMDRGSDMSGRRYYDNGSYNRSNSGNRYYDDERTMAINKLHEAMEHTKDPDVHMYLQDAINKLGMK